MKQLLLTTILALLAAACGTPALRPPADSFLPRSDAAPPDFSPVRKRIERAVAAGEVASLTVAVAVEGRVVWEQGFGYADRERAVTATPDTIYPIASVSKPITATGLLLLADRGLLRLDRPVNTYLGAARLTGYGGNADAVTIRNLLQHRGGLPSHGRYFFEDEEADSPPVEETIRRYGIVVGPPGAAYRYSNLGFGILAYLTQRLSGHAYPEFMQKTVFRPLGMTRTSIQTERHSNVEVAKLYDPAEAPIPYYRFDEWGSGRVFSTVRDLVRFGLYHLDRLDDPPDILSDAMRRAMVMDRQSTGSATGRYGTDWFYALGWGGREATRYGPYWYGHDGRMPGVSSELKLLPKEGAVIAILSNSRSDLPGEVATSIMDIIVPGYRNARAVDPAFTPAAVEIPVLPDGRIVGLWSGKLRTWNGDYRIRLRVEPRGNAFLSINGAAEAQLSKAVFSDGTISGTAGVPVPLPEASGVPHTAEVALRLDGSSLVGTVHASGAPPRYRLILPSWAELRRGPPER